MKPFLGEDFLLETEASRRLYHGYAAAMPILDYHSHLPPEQIADDTRFGNLAQVWLGGDHYKWRLMRANGVPEADITGHPADERTFRAWARTVPRALGNPVYHWTHLELQRYFGVTSPLDESSAPAIWATCNEQLADPAFSVQNLLQRMNVVAVCTTDDPVDSLEHHGRHAAAARPVLMAPTFRPDKAIACDQPAWPAYVRRLGAAAGVEVTGFRSLVEALDVRHRAFHDAGCRLSDHALVTPWSADSDSDLDTVAATLLAGGAVSDRDREALQTALLAAVGAMNHARDWTMQLHIGAQRNLNSAMFGSLGPDTGYDAISDEPIARKLAAFLNRLARDAVLPQTILYSLHPGSHDAMASVMGAFQDGTAAGKIQLGSAWWFNDHIDGMDLQLRTLANHGLLSRFVGMLTDSRSFLSFPRHEYFRRVLCRLVGGWMDQGLVPNDEGLVGALIQDVCYRNARDFLRLPGLTE